jgi:hypothetical protein
MAKKKSTEQPKAEQEAQKPAEVENKEAPAEQDQQPSAPEEPKAEQELPESVEATFKARKDIKEAYINGEQYFFDKRLAKRLLKQFETVANPFYGA